MPGGCNDCTALSSPFSRVYNIIGKQYIHTHMSIFFVHTHSRWGPLSSGVYTSRLTVVQIYTRDFGRAIASDGFNPVFVQAEMGMTSK